jgi:XTP/dITP diphosphohydrolase
MNLELVFATQNENKVAEVQSVFPPNVSIVSLKRLGFEDELQEDHETLEENAKQKARFVFEKFGRPCFAEDAGLEVDLLDGEPGVKSARYAGPGKSAKDNVSKLLERLIGSKDRSALFRAVIAFHDGVAIHTFEGRCYGRIAPEARGSNGFGYDPVFIPDGFETTFAEMEPDEKHRISHRTAATKAFISHLDQTWNASC